ncbi:uncharacterized protein LOC123542659 [Mercenaria mercenaria]|uniref:uncharacterized protein LOC123542659 n=1 Tax=Mercenaria mercenaria TaxID=6596 RepID=UPI00234EC90F|nr:uncharacterized protein LOC123542659 [Mercenaria mercenaria]
MPKKLNLVVAACNNNGIGINGKLPWRLKKDMEFFKKITSDTNNPDRQNAVIMGRKTWVSIPEKFRPLKGRVNIVLSRELKEVPEGVHIARSLPEALSLVETAELSDQVENVHIIGGSSVYKEAMMGPYQCRIYLTKVLKDFECDTYLPEILEDKFQKIPNPENVPVELQEENDVKFRFEVYEKVVPQNGPVDLQNTSLNQPMESLGSSHDPSPLKEPIRFDVMSAMCHGNRGIGYKMGLPWPKLQKDYEYYSAHVSTRQDKKSVGKKIIQIRGRLTWLSAMDSERNAPNVYTIIVSGTWTERDCDSPRVLKIVPTFNDAVALINDLHQRNEVDSVWIMGGSGIYQEAICHPQFSQLYLTHVYTDFPADAFFPAFEDRLTEVTDHPEKGTVYEDNGVKYEFKVYKKRSNCN